jgi:indole-3-glycerol phosphate synthase
MNDICVIFKLNYMNILDKIILHKQKEVAQAKEKTATQTLERMPFFERNPISLKKSLQKGEKTGIIAEYKRKSPSKGIINDRNSVEEVVKGYESAGASAVSVLTDWEFFGGNTEDVIQARQTIEIPILRKEFIIDEYQIIEAKAIGADLILLISACLEPAKLKRLAQFAKSLQLDVLMEVHHQAELETTLNEFIDLVGVNNRNLKTFEVSIQTSLDLVHQIPDDFIKISESGISEVKTILQLKEAGFQGFLIGENFMKSDNPMKEAEAFMKLIR